MRAALRALTLAHDSMLVLVGSRCASTSAKSTLTGLSTLEVEWPSANVAHVKLNRPKARNAFTPEMWDELYTTFNALDIERACRAVVLSGNGASFCAGIDLKLGFAAMMKTMHETSEDAGRRANVIRDTIKRYQASFTALEKCRKPVICAIHSHCYGAATSLITAADVRYASKDAVFSIREVAVGLAADVGVLQRVNRVVGNDSWTRELVFSARDSDANEAHRYGLVSRLLDTHQECVTAALALAADIAAKSPIAVEGSKMALNHARNNSTEVSLDWIAAHNQAMLQAADMSRIGEAAARKQQPHFEDA